MKTTGDKKQHHRFDQYIIEYNNDVVAENFNDEYCWGIRVKNGNWQYEIINSTVGHRLLINNKENYHSRDVPFNLNTANLLPKSVTVRLA